MKKAKRISLALLKLFLPSAGFLCAATLFIVLAVTQTMAYSWTITGDLNTPRFDHTATLLNNGKVLISGGSAACSTSLSNSELYDPASGVWSITGSLNTGRYGHTATLLGNGQVLVVGGKSSEESFVNSAELYDPATGVWRFTRSFNSIVASGSATLLPNGKVLVIGATGPQLRTVKAELYDPTTETWSNILAPNFVPSINHSVLLPNGKVLAVYEGDPFEANDVASQLYDPATGQWSSNSFFPLFWAPTVTPLPNGNVLVTGLAGTNNFTQAFIYDYGTGTWSRTGDLTTFRHYGGYTATLLADGQVLVAGGIDYNSDQPISAEELFNPSTGTWSRITQLTVGRHLHTATLLPSGKALIAGGAPAVVDVCNASLYRSTELYDPGITLVTNPIDDAQFFVRRHYLDFLNREPDAPGLAYWINQLTECQQPGATCDANVRRINVSAAFFLSIEFQETGYLVERLYKSAYGDADGFSRLDTYPDWHPIKVPVVRLNEFQLDNQEIARNLVVGQPGWEQLLEGNKVAFILAFVQRVRFTTAFPTSLTPDQFVDKLFQKAGVTPTTAERTAAINQFGGAVPSADPAARGRALRLVAENPTLNENEKNRAFVLMQYFGYLRRNPDDRPDTDHTGYDFWLRKLNQFGGNFVEAQMVQAFIVSTEYRQRFGP